MMDPHHSEPHLTPREVECLTWLARGLKQEALAEELKLSKPTVEMHLGNARKKLAAKTSTHAVAIAVSRGLIAP